MTFYNDKIGFYFICLLNFSDRSKRRIEVFDLLQMSQYFHIEIIVRKIEDIRCILLDVLGFGQMSLEISAFRLRNDRNSFKVISFDNFLSKEVQLPENFFLKTSYFFFFNRIVV